MTFFQKTTLPSGLRVITETIPHVRSATVGVWVGSGSRWESPEVLGVSHVIEHMLFKGTASRSARDLVQAIEGRGGHLNAFTAKEHTCYHAKVLDEHLPVAIEILADMVLGSRFDPAELAKEKGVILEEIKMYDDAPDDVVHELFAGALWPGNPLGLPIVGSAESVRNLTRDHLLQYFRTHYVGERMVVAAAGNLHHEEVVELVARAFDGLPSLGGAGLEWPEAPRRTGSGLARVRTKETEQAHVVLGMPGLHQDHDEIYALHLLNTVLGGGSASRMFQTIREERGLAYSVYTYHSSFRDAGNFAVYAGVSPGAVTPVLELIDAALAEAGRDGVRPDELAEAKEQLKGQIMLGLESTSGRMSRLGRGELTLGRVLHPDEIIERINGVTVEEIQALAARLFIDRPRVLAAVGPFSELPDLAPFGFAEVRHD